MHRLVFPEKEIKVESDEEPLVEPIPKHWGFYHTKFDILGLKKKKKPKSNASIQTKKVWTSDAVTTMLVKSVEIQTMEIPNPKPIVKYPTSLVKFFRKVTPMLCYELENNARLDEICIFKDLVANLPVVPVENEVKIEPRKMFSFKNSSGEQSKRNAVTLSWSRSGFHMAVSYSDGQHGIDWCHHRSSLAIYNLNKLSSKPDDQFPVPEREFLDLDSCITALEFSPQEGFMLAVGKENGEIGLLDCLSGGRTSGTDFGKNPKQIWKHGYHSGRIVAIKWISLTSSQVQGRTWKNPQVSNQFLISASRDGFIGLWSTGRFSFSLHLEKKFALQTENIPESVPIVRDAYQVVQHLGITCMSCSDADMSKIVFSTIGSLVFTGDIFSSLEINNHEPKPFVLDKNRPAEILYCPDPIFVTSQQGCIVALHCSPFHQSYVLSLTSDGHLLLQNVHERGKPALEFYVDVQPLSVDVKWSPHRPMMFAVATAQNLCIYDLLKDKSNPSLVLKHEYQLKSIEFNQNFSGEIAIADVEGEVFVWELPLAFSKRQPRELAHLVDLEHNEDPSEPWQFDSSSEASEVEQVGKVVKLCGCPECEAERQERA